MNVGNIVYTLTFIIVIIGLFFVIYPDIKGNDYCVEHGFDGGNSVNCFRQNCRTNNIGTRVCEDVIVTKIP